MSPPNERQLVRRSSSGGHVPPLLRRRAGCFGGQAATADGPPQAETGPSEANRREIVPLFRHYFVRIKRNMGLEVLQCGYRQECLERMYKKQKGQRRLTIPILPLPIFQERACGIKRAD